MFLMLFFIQKLHWNCPVLRFEIVGSMQDSSAR